MLITRGNDVTAGCRDSWNAAGPWTAAGRAAVGYLAKQQPAGNNGGSHGGQLQGKKVRQQPAGVTAARVPQSRASSAASDTTKTGSG